MDINEAVKIANDFRSYNDIGDKNLITKYSLETLRTALNKYLPTDKGSLWYKAIEARIEELARDKEAKLAKSKEIKKTVEYLILVSLLSIIVILTVQWISSLSAKK